VPEEIGLEVSIMNGNKLKNLKNYLDDKSFKLTSSHITSKRKKFYPSAMKTLILTSSGQFITANNVDHFLPKKITDCKIAYIVTASKKVSDTGYIDRHRQKMDELNFSYDEIDIAGMNENELKKALDGHDIIMVEGGNTFYLLKAIRETGFAEILKELLNEGKVYIGTSAGAYVMCPTIEVSDWNPDGKDRFGVTDFTALNYVPFVLKVHYKDEQEETVKKGIKTLKYPIHILKDGQGMFVEDGKYTFIGDGEEVKLN